MTSAVYPLLPEETFTKMTATSAHVLLHLSKQTGKLAGLFEPMLHGRAEVTGGAHGEVSRQVAYTIIDVLRLAALAGVTAEDIAEEIAQWEREQNVHSS
jgi:hypothetical protein